MQDRHLFEYAVIRVVPRVEREEFFNAGVILYCSGLKFLQSKVFLDSLRLQALCPLIDFKEVEERLFTFEKICSGLKDGGPIAVLPISSRFRWLTATRSTVIQTSSVHPGFCLNADETLAKLFTQLVQ